MNPATADAVVGLTIAGAVGVAIAPSGRRAVRALDARRRGIARLRLRSVRSLLGWGGRRADTPDARVRVVVAQVAALLRAGAPPGAAWTRAAGVKVDELGVPDVAALSDVVGEQAARSVAAATRLALTVGAPLGRVLAAVSDALAAQAEADAEREAALAGPRTTAHVLVWLPAAGALLGWVLGADPVAAATGGGVGSAAVGAGLVLLAVGRWWTGRLVEAARRAGEGT